MIVTNKNLKAKQRRQNGFGLIEVLVALVIVSFGVLGMASLQLSGMKHSSGGFNRSKALMAAQSMATRIRLNVNTEAAAVYSGFDSDNAFSCANIPAKYCQASPLGGAVATCDSTELAELDLFTVACGDVGSEGATKGVVGSLPNGSLTVQCDPAPCVVGSTYQVDVLWNEGKARTDSDEIVTRRVQVKLKP